MTLPANELSDTGGAKGGRRGRVSIVLALLGCAGLAAGIGWYVWYRAPAPEPPAVELTGVDPAIVAAVQQAEAAVRNSPRSASAWGRLGMVLLTHDFTAEAKTCLAQAERFDPGEPRWPYFQGYATLDENADAALVKLQRAVELCGDMPLGPRMWLAEALLGQDRLDEAEHHYRRILQHDPRDELALLGLGRLAYRRGNLQESLDHVQRSLDAGSPRKSAYLLLAEIHQRLGDKVAAEKASRRAASLRDDPPLPDPFTDELLQLRTGERANIKRAQKLLDLGRVPQAVRLLQRLVRDYPDSAGSWLMLGRALVRQKALLAGVQALNKAIQLAPDNPEIQVQMGIALYYQANPRAAEHFRKATQIKPDCAPAYFNLGLSLIREGDSTGAIDAFRTAVRIEPNLTDAYIGLGSQLALKGQMAEAVQHLHHAVQLNPADRRAQQLLKQALQRIAIPTIP